MSERAVAVVPAQPLSPWSPAREGPATREGSPVAGVVPDVLADGACGVAQPLAGAPEPSLGAAAQLASRLAFAGIADDMPGAPIVTVSPLSKRPGDAPEVAAGLRQAIESSGLFYESHLADWIDGRKTHAGLQHEPQATLAADGAGAATSALSGPAEGGRLAPHAEILVQRQLAVLEHRAVRWQGEAWPGQAAEVRIAEDQGGARDQDTAGRRSWRAALRVSMRSLGDVEAHIGLAGSKAQLAFQAADPAGARALLNGRADLARALNEHGLTLIDLKVERDAARESR